MAGEIIVPVLLNKLSKTAQKNTEKALSRWFSAWVDTKVAVHEGKAAAVRAATAEDQAASDARIMLTHRKAELISMDMGVSPEYALEAERQFGKKILREQINIDQVSKHALKQLALEREREREREQSSQGDAQENVTGEIGDDWLNRFEAEARQASSEEMQFMFGKILAGEIQRPRTYSIKTLKLLGELDSSTAELFQRACSLSISLIEDGEFIDARILSFRKPAGDNGLEEYGLPYGHIINLIHHGLVNPELSTSADYSRALVRPEEPHDSFKYLNRGWLLTPIGEEGLRSNLQLKGVLFSKTGLELLRIVEQHEVVEYTESLIEFFDNKQLLMTEV